VATETRTFRAVTADGSAHVKFASATNAVICGTLTHKGVPFPTGKFRQADIPDLISGPGYIEVTAGLPGGVVLKVW
jgi:hypothetical protein